MKTEIVNCDRCNSVIPDGPPNSWYMVNITVAWTTNIAIPSNDLCANCWNDYQTFIKNQVVNPR